MDTRYPCCPGHEVAGVVGAVGSGVTKFKVGDRVGVGCFVDACLDCRHCKMGYEQFCVGGMTATYNSTPAHGRAGTEYTKGGYSNLMVVHENFVVAIHEGIPLEKAGPVLCAGITTYAPLRKYNIGKGSRVGVNGLGGLGTMAVKQAKALGAEVTVVSRSGSKEAYARSIGASHFVVSSDPASVAKAKGTVDLMVDTVSMRHDLGVNALDASGLFSILDIDGAWCFCGLILDMQDGARCGPLRSSLGGSAHASHHASPPARSSAARAPAARPAVPHGDAHRGHGLAPGVRQLLR